MWLDDIVMDIQLSGFTDVISWTKHEDIFRKDCLLIENVLEFTGDS
ncbi:Sentrin-specific protease 3 [Labeo rohita]|uniref:Sentrin-specific protease 3 n=1 Tax=Labeo rohita TaxID=84645 RepID=A0ABQ8L2E1_LABRO|nr:Sentrin-specific protease 3 [Labeo rohita]